ncbi:MAG: alpha/beta hydrolase [Actinobacteria bacterium]|nr:MAG: alpha/beta hydrolase [Actinomycetota bacterium]
MRLRGLIVLTALCAALGAVNAAPAAGALFVPCGANGLECVTVNVPLDRSGGTPGTVSLHVEELPAPGMPRGVLFLIAGGPGQASSGTFALGANAVDLRGEYPGYTLIAFDPRGTGRSGLLRCPELQADPFAELTREQALVAKCATETGPSRAFYSTRDHVDDIDAVRRALGVDKIALWGTSYGTQLSVAYALTYPSHVERLLLDSVADPAGRDPFARDDLQQMPKGLASLCSGGLCRAATSNFVGEVVTLANRMAAHPVTSKVATPSGGTRTVRATGFMRASPPSCRRRCTRPSGVGRAPYSGSFSSTGRRRSRRRRISAWGCSPPQSATTARSRGIRRRRSRSARACSQRPGAPCRRARPGGSAFGRPTLARPPSASSGRLRRAVRESARGRFPTCRCSSSPGSATSVHPPRMRPRSPRASRRDGS